VKVLGTFNQDFFKNCFQIRRNFSYFTVISSNGHLITRFSSVKTYSSSVQFIFASRPNTEYFIRSTGAGSDGRSCHLSHCPHQ